ncbi:MAG: thiamine phosphate synthase [Halomonas sp.]|jgi:thiamine-phosphate pyrophosphorylase|uniref:Thiamine-phosphate synthase n=1 Tax=Billgrantia tianxiuensis TaxID=2497861 RepID=A0A6I6SJJ1_9GAMM|nr:MULTISPECIES: thiamine phosphate synthase [Halomonas]MCE8034868.1 thiamine phosphate synthase [Halomonas sp. MCCC 1A11057]MDX5435279.1 thiamine phosphate synthase [Halomonas sp.]QHC48594.1 thiamine phosphate synthase [Halomonas tianxiuensis]
MPLDLSLYLVTDPELCARHGLVETVVAAVRGGVTVVQLRDKRASDGEMIDQARRLKAALAGSGVPLIINDRLAVAMESGADGLHMGQDDGDVAAARSALGEEAILGLSVQNHTQLAHIDPVALDYLGFGPVFATSTKRDHATPLGFDGLAALVAASPLPAVAIGGLKAEHARQVWGAGAKGPAVVSAICGQPDPEAAARAFFDD